MSLQAFYKNNAIPAGLVERVAVSNRFLDENGEPLLWELKALPPKRFMALTSDSVQMSASGEMSADVDGATFRLIAAVVQFPNLQDAALQDSYGVRGAADLLDAMLDTREFSALLRRVNAMHNAGKPLDKMVDEVKND